MKNVKNPRTGEWRVGERDGKEAEGIDKNNKR